MAFNLAEKRKERAAAREGRGEPPQLVFDQVGGPLIVLLPVEVPISVFEPLQEINVDIAFFVKQLFAVWQSQQESDEGGRTAAIGMLTDILVANPDLPVQVLNAGRECLKRLIGDEAYDAFIAMKPSVQDVRDLLTYLAEQYGVGLGEASESTDSSQTNGPTSSPTSDGSTDLTPEVSSLTLAPPVSSEPADSSS
jgi:hypothetical protein